MASASQTIDEKIRVKQITVKAGQNLKAARGLVVQKYGVGSIFRFRFWALYFTQLVLSKPVPVLITIIIAGIAMMCIFFGVISAAYVVYNLKSIPCVTANFFLTIGNAIWFAFNAISNLLLNGFVQIINGMEYYFLKPLIDAINFIANFLTSGDIVEFKPVVEGGLITMQPTHGFSYWIPDPVKWGDWGSLITFTPIKPGAAPYLTGEFTSVVQQNGAELLYPLYNVEGVAEGPNPWWSEVIGRPNDVYYSFFRSQQKYLETMTDFIARSFESFKNMVLGWFNNPFGINWPDIWTIGPFLLVKVERWFKST